MEAFLEKIAAHITEKYGSGMGRLCIVLPNRRAGLFLRKHLAEKVTEPVWSPVIFSIEDFVKELSGYQLPDPVDLLFEFYQVYLQNTQTDVQSFEDFGKWAPVLLNDFNEVDSYLVEGKDLFANLKNIKNIENWSLAGETLTEFQKNYLNWWDRLGAYYHEFRKRLLSKNMGYQGMAYRSVAKDIGLTPALSRGEGDWSKIIFAGFNALNTAEEKIISALLQRGDAEIFWDADAYYTGNSLQEAGKFIRKYRKTLSAPFSKDVLWEENNLSAGKKNIFIIGCAKNVMQAKTAGSILSEQGKEAIEKTAVVLADEKLLNPVLNSLPDNVDTVNITMGISLSKTPIADYFDLVFNLHENSKGGKLFYHKDLIKFARHPYSYYLFSPALLNKIIRHIQKRNRVFISVKNLEEFSGHGDLHLFNSVLAGWKDTKDAFSCIASLLESLDDVLYVSENKVSLDKEYIGAYSKVVTRLQSLSNTYRCIDTIQSLHRVLNQLIRSTSLPFYGEPLQGLQMMGMLETRTLDFENILLLSANENILPENKTKSSFIPFDLKKAFGLPTYNDRDAIYAYHFYRLIQRAKNVYILYNTENDELGKGEKSRFVTQLVHELPTINPDIKIEESIVNAPMAPDPAGKGISIQKTQQILDKIDQKARQGFSPSLLNTYKNCSLQFYFQYIAGLKEADEVEETIGADVLGNVIHKALEELYLPFVGKNITSADVEQMQKSVTEKVEAAFEEEYSKSDLKYGKNLLTVKIAEKFLRQFLNNEKEFLKNNVLTIESLEQEIKTSLSFGEGRGEVKIKGKIDRIDTTGNVLRIIDYKTGSVADKELKVNDWEELLTDVGLNKSFQLLMYAYLYRKHHPENQKALRSGIISFRKLSSGVKNIVAGGSEELDDDVLSNFERQLKKLIENIYDPAIPFSQTKEIERCEYCSFKMICNR